MADKSFTFWENMKTSIDHYEDPVLKYKLYNALVEYGLYGIMPEKDNTLESQVVAGFVQELVPSLDKSRNYYQKASENGKKGGRPRKINEEQMTEALIKATKLKNDVPTREEVIEQARIIINDPSLGVDQVSNFYDARKKREFAERLLAEERQKGAFEVKSENSERVVLEQSNEKNQRDTFGF